MMRLYTCLFLCSDEDKQAFEVWHAHDDAEDTFCELDGESVNLECGGLKYIWSTIITFTENSNPPGTLSYMYM